MTGVWGKEGQLGMLSMGRGSVHLWFLFHLSRSDLSLDHSFVGLSDFVVRVNKLFSSISVRITFHSLLQVLCVYTEYSKYHIHMISMVEYRGKKRAHHAVQIESICTVYSLGPCAYLMAILFITFYGIEYITRAHTHALTLTVHLCNKTSSNTHGRSLYSLF